MSMEAMAFGARELIGSALIYDDHPGTVRSFEDTLRGRDVEVQVTGDVPHFMRLLHDVEQGVRQAPNLFLMDVHVDQCRGFESLGKKAVMKCDDTSAGFQLAEE